MEWLLRLISRVVTTRPRTIYCVFGLFTVASLAGLIAGYLPLDTSREGMISDESPWRRRYLEYQELFGTPNVLIVVVEGKQFKSTKRAVEQIAQALTKEETVREVFYKVDFKDFIPFVPLYLSVQTIDEFAASATSASATSVLQPPKPARRLRAEGLTQLLEDSNRFLEEAMESQKAPSGDVKSIRTRGEGFLEFIEGVLTSFNTALAGTTPLLVEHWLELFDPKVRELWKDFSGHGFIGSRDGTTLFLLVSPSRNTEQFDFVGPFVEQCSRVARKAAGDDVTVSFTGMPAFAYEEFVSLKRDMSTTSLVALGGILVLFMFTYRSLWLSIVLVVPLVVGMVLTLGSAIFTVGRLNLASSSFGAILIGLGIDFGIQLFTRYREHRRKGESPKEAAVLTVQVKGRSVVTAALSTSLAFWAIAMSEFEMFSELGVISGTGLILLVASTLFLLPALLIALDTKLLGEGSWLGTPRSRVIGAVSWLGLKKPWLTVSIGIAVTIMLVLRMQSTEVQLEARALLPADSEALTALEKLERLSGFRPEYVISIAGSTEELAERDAKLRKLPTIQNTLSVSTFLPARQEEKVPKLKVIQQALLKYPKVDFVVSDKVDVNRLLSALDNFRSILYDDLVFAISGTPLESLTPRIRKTVVPKLDRLIKNLRSMDRAEAEQKVGAFQREAFRVCQLAVEFFDKPIRPVTPNDLPSYLLRQFYRKTNGEENLALHVYPAGDIEDRVFLEKFQRDVRSVDRKATGFPINHWEFAKLTDAGFRSAALYALVGVLLMLLLDLKDPFSALLALIPLGIAVVWLLGTMGLFGVEFNFVSILAIPLILGIGIAYGIYIVHRARLPDGVDSMGEVIRTTGQAVSLSALTTIIGFGSLSLASHRGVASLGNVLVLGVGSSLLAALFVLPALLSWIRRAGIRRR